jgi:hypothetical protein
MERHDEDAGLSQRANHVTILRRIVVHVNRARRFSRLTHDFDANPIRTPHFSTWEFFKGSSKLADDTVATLGSALRATMRCSGSMGTMVTRRAGADGHGSMVRLKDLAVLIVALEKVWKLEGV